MGALLSMSLWWALLIVAAPAVPGVATRTRALLTGRRGAPAWQLYLDLWKLLRRGVVYSRTTTAVFRLAPLVLLASTVMAVMLLPLDGRRSLLSFSGDAVAFVTLLAIGRFSLVLAALDTGSSFEGMGASREVTFASLVEPGLLLALVALSVATSRLSLEGMLGPELWRQWPAMAPTSYLVAGSLFLLMLAECARVPVDDPATHLELTMIHEAMVLDHSGPDLALILYANALKLAAFIVVILNLLVPRPNLAGPASGAVLLAALAAGGIAVGVVEASTARLRLLKVPLYLAGGGALGFLGLILLLQ
jgi:formate hydrogenlyase subunit 4